MCDLIIIRVKYGHLLRVTHLKWSNRTERQAVKQSRQSSLFDSSSQLFDHLPLSCLSPLVSVLFDHSPRHYYSYVEGISQLISYGVSTGCPKSWFLALCLYAVVLRHLSSSLYLLWYSADDLHRQLPPRHPKPLSLLIYPSLSPHLTMHFRRRTLPIISPSSPTPPSQPPPTHIHPSSTLQPPNTALYSPASSLYPSFVTV